MKSAQFSSLLVFSMFEGKTRWIGLLIMMVLPYVKAIIKYLWEKILSCYYPTFVYITLRQKQNKEGAPLSNFSYNAMCWYCIEKYCDRQVSLLCESNSVKKNQRVGTMFKRIPDYYPNNKFVLIHEEETIHISFSSSSDAKSITLQSSRMQTLTAFVSFVTKAYEDHCYNDMNPDKIYVCEWKLPRYSRDEVGFVSTEMTIKKTYQNIYLPRKLIEGIKKDILEFKSNEEFYEKSGIPYKRGYLFYGPPGTGKTSTAYAIARENGMNLHKTDLASLTYCPSSFGITPKRAFQKIPPGSVVLIEEVDTQVYNDRTSSVNSVNSCSSVNQKEKDTDEDVQENKGKKESQLNKIPMSKLMEVLDGYDILHGCIVILTTNHKEYLDEALIRPGRVDMHYFFGSLSNDDIKTTIKRFTGFDITVPTETSMTSSTLINQILLPNRRDRLGIQKLITNYK